MKDILTILISILILILGIYLMTFKIVNLIILTVGLGFLFLFALSGLYDIIYPLVDHLFKKKKK